MAGERERERESSLFDCPEILNAAPWPERYLKPDAFLALFMVLDFLYKPGVFNPGETAGTKAVIKRVVPSAQACLKNAASSFSRRMAAVWFSPVDAASLAVFRICFGLILLWEVYRFFSGDWIGSYWSGKEFYFTFWPFDFIRPWPAELMYVHLAVMGVLAVFIIVGFLYRFSAAGFFLMITYLFLLEQARYLNHLYLVCLLCFLLVFVPANRCWSVDAWLRPSIRSSVVPGWSLWLLRFQVALPMFFAGVSKLNVDWLTRAEPLRIWLSDGPFLPFVGYFLQTSPVVIWILVYGALAIDLLFVGYMTHRRTRIIGFGFVLLFHLLNSVWFGIGIFPWMMIVATLLFFGPDWPRRVWADLKARHSYRLYAIAAGGLIGELAVVLLRSRDGFDPVKMIVGGFGFAIWAYHLDEPFRRAKPSVQVLKKNDAIQTTERWRFIIACFLCLWISVQVLVPLRHFAIPWRRELD